MQHLQLDELIHCQATVNSLSVNSRENETRVQPAIMQLLDDCEINDVLPVSPQQQQHRRHSNNIHHHHHHHPFALRFNCNLQNPCYFV